MKNYSTSQTQKPKTEDCVNWDGFTLGTLFKAGTLWVEKHIEELDSIDVFPPPPSGSAGTRIHMTMLAGCKEIKVSPNSTASDVVHAFSHGSLLGARGHQGVPFSQWFRGFARGVGRNSTISAGDFANALMEAATTTYRGYVKPIEGDMWSVAKDVAEIAKQAAEEIPDLYYVLQKSIEEAKRSVERTTELIPLLKEVGVVHAGGLALFYFLDGMNRYLNGEITASSLDFDNALRDD